MVYIIRPFPPQFRRHPVYNQQMLLMSAPRRYGEPLRQRPLIYASPQLRQQYRPPPPPPASFQILQPPILDIIDDWPSEYGSTLEWLPDERPVNASVDNRMRSLKDMNVTETMIATTTTTNQMTKSFNPRQITMKTFIGQQNYPRQYYPRLPTSAVKHAEVKYPPHIYLDR